MRSFEELLAAKNATSAAAKSRSFEELLAAKQASEAPAPVAVAGRAGRGRAFPKTVARPESEFTTGEQLTDVARTAGRANQASSEFMADLAGFIIPSVDLESGRLTEPTMTSRVKKGFERAGEGEGVWDTIKGFGRGLMEPTEFGKRTAAAFKPPEFMAEQIGEGEGDPWLDPAKKAAQLTTELATTAWMGGTKAAPMLAKTLPLSVTGGVVGEELGGTGGEIAGVIAGALSMDAPGIINASKKLISSISGAPTKLKRLVKSGDTAAKASDAENRRAIGEIVRHIYSGEEAVSVKYIDDLFKRAKEASAKGEKGTLGQLTGDAGILDFEKQYAFNQRRGDLDAVNMGLADDALSPMADVAPGGVVERAGALPKAIVQDSKNALQDERLTKLAAANTASDQAVAPFKEVPSTTAASAGLKDTMQTAANDSYAGVRQAWDALPPGSMDRKTLDDSLKIFYDSPVMGKNATTTFKRDFKDIIDRIESLEGDINIDEMSDVLSHFSSKIGQISRGQASGAALKPERIEAFKNAIYDAMDAGVDGASDARTAAARASRQHFEKYGKTTRIGKALEAGDEEFAGKVIGTGDAGASKRADLVEAGGPQAASDADTYLTGVMNRNIDDAGEFTPGSVKTFEKQYGEQLSPEMQAKVTALREAGEGQKVAGTRAKEIDKEVTALDKSIAGTFASTGGTEAEILAAVKQAMTPTPGKDVSAGVRELLDSVKGNPQATEDIQRAFMQNLTNSVTKDGTLTQGGLKQFKQLRPMMEESGLYTPKQMQTIEDGLVEGQKMFLHKDAKKLGNLPAEERRIAETLAALGGAKIGALSFGSPLIGAALGRKFAVNTLRELGSDKIRKIAFEFSMNPEKLVKYTDKLNDASLSDVERANTIVDMMAAALSASRVAPIENE